MNKQMLLFILKLGRFVFWTLGVCIIPLFLTSTSILSSVIVALAMVYIWLDLAVVLFYFRKLGVIEYNNSVLLWPIK